MKQQQEDRRYDELVEQMKLAAYAVDPQAAAHVDTSSIQHPKWYIQDRSSLSSYSNIESDAASIEAVGTAFPIVFFTVAILIALTTITRMVEEERLLIGTYKALGFRNIEIMKKYLLYAGVPVCWEVSSGISADSFCFRSLCSVSFRHYT